MSNTKTLTEQIKIYNEQQTASGKVRQKHLQQLTDRLNNIEGVHVKSGTLTPIRHWLTGEVSAFLES